MTLPREVTYDTGLGQLLFAPITEQEQLRNASLAMPPAAASSAGLALQRARPLLLSEHWPVGAVRQAEVMVELALPTALTTITLTVKDKADLPNASTATHFRTYYTPPAVGVRHTVVVGAVCDRGYGCTTTNGLSVEPRKDLRFDLETTRINSQSDRVFRNEDFR